MGRGPTREESKIDFEAEHPPLLLIAGDADHIIPPSLVDKVYRKYQKSPSVTELQHFDGRVHWICAEPGWEEVATASEAFLREQLESTP